MIDFDAEKRRLEQMNILAVEKLKASQPLDYEPKKQARDGKKLLTAIGILLGLLLAVAALSQSGVL